MLFRSLVDGFQYEVHTGVRMRHEANTNSAVFSGTADEPLAHAGPWLIDITKSPVQLEEIEALEQALPSVSWIITHVDLEGLSQLLQLKLDAQLPDGHNVLLRFYDPRVLGNPYLTLDGQQRDEFFHLIDEWHFMYKGQWVVAGRNHA